MVPLFAVRFVFDLVGCVILLCCVISVRPFGFVICFVFGWTRWLVCWRFWLVLGVLCALAGGLIVHFCLCVDCVCCWVWFCGFMLYVGLCWDGLVFGGVVVGRFACARRFRADLPWWFAVGCLGVF